MTPSQFKDLTDICTEVAVLRAENKCLREDRDAWKEHALRIADGGSEAMSEENSSSEPVMYACQKHRTQFCRGCQCPECADEAWNDYEEDGPMDLEDQLDKLLEQK